MIVNIQKKIVIYIRFLNVSSGRWAPKVAQQLIDLKNNDPELRPIPLHPMIMFEVSANVVHFSVLICVKHRDHAGNAIV